MYMIYRIHIRANNYYMFRQMVHTNFTVSDGHAHPRIHILDYYVRSSFRYTQDVLDCFVSLFKLENQDEIKFVVLDHRVRVEKYNVTIQKAKFSIMGLGILWEDCEFMTNRAIYEIKLTEIISTCMIERLKEI